uniref:Uncharacterized protein n=1 Tax=viral metagenome TaxID=1070528 RepID=A0A6C0J4Y2_9ZZZZ
MEVETLDFVPKEWTHGKTYETIFLYTGFGRVNTHDNLLQTILPTTTKNRMYIKERPLVPGLLSRVYHSEMVRMTIYSEHPRVWSEEVNPGQVFFFRECGKLTQPKT